jgi:hypothetical protein
MTGRYWKVTDGDTVLREFKTRKAAEPYLKDTRILVNKVWKTLTEDEPPADQK